MQRAGVEQCRRAADETERGKHFVKFNRAFVLLFAFVDRESHRDAHPKILHRFQSPSFVMNQITVVKRLRAHVSELLVAVETQRGGEIRQIKLQQVQARAV